LISIILINEHPATVLALAPGRLVIYFRKPLITCLTCFAALAVILSTVPNPSSYLSVITKIKAKRAAGKPAARFAFILLV